MEAYWLRIGLEGLASIISASLDGASNLEESIGGSEIHGEAFGVKVEIFVSWEEVIIWMLKESARGQSR